MNPAPVLKTIIHLPFLIVLLFCCGCQSNFKNYHDNENVKYFAENQHSVENNKDAFIVDTGTAVYLILPVIIPKNLNEEQDNLWYELALRKTGFNALVHVRLDLCELKKDKIVYTTHIIHQSSKHETFTRTIANDDSILIRLDDPHFYQSIFQPFDGKLELNLYHNLKKLKFGSFYEMNSQNLEDAVLNL